MTEAFQVITYRLPLRFALGLAFACAAPLLFALSYAAFVFGRVQLELAAPIVRVGVLLVLGVVAVALLSLRTYVVADRSKLRVMAWSMAWDEVRSARVRSVLGVRWVVIERTKGRPWKVWWSLPGAPDFIVRVLEVVPRGNPLHECVQQGEHAGGARE